MIDREFFDELQDEYEDIFQEGVEARKNGLTLKDNPYNDFFSEYWIEGWREEDESS